MWRTGAAAAITAIFLLSWFGLTPLPSCMFRTLTGFSCATCGMTRAFQAAAHGDILPSLGYNPAGTMLFFMLPLVLLKLSLELYFGRSLRIGIPRPLVRTSLAILLGLWLGFGAARLLLELSGKA